MAEGYDMDKVFANIEKNLNEHPKPIEGLKAIYQFDLSGDHGGTYQLHLSGGEARVEKGEAAPADCRIKMKEQHFMDMLQGRLNGTSAFMTRKLKVNGSMSLALKLQNILGSYA